jgi:pimeloyl-ACP methyl ester carboxylesterase
MFMFGFLNFFQPIRGSFDVQIQQSHLPREAILVGKVTEMVTGVLFLLPWLRRSLTAKSKDQILLIACFIIFTQMAVAIYVHLQDPVFPLDEWKFEADRAHSHVIEVNSSHAVPVSNPDVVADVIEQAARATTK